MSLPGLPFTLPLAGRTIFSSCETVSSNLWYKVFHNGSVGGVTVTEQQTYCLKNNISFVFREFRRVFPHPV